MVLLVKITATFALNYHRGESYDSLDGAKLHAAMLATNDETRNVSFVRIRRTIFDSNVAPLTSQSGIRKSYAFLVRFVDAPDVNPLIGVDRVADRTRSKR